MAHSVHASCPRGVGGVPRMQKLRPTPPPPPCWWDPRDLKDSLFLTKPVVVQIIALHAVPDYRAATYLVSAFPANSNSSFSNFFNPQRWNVY